MGHGWWPASRDVWTVWARQPGCRMGRTGTRLCQLSWHRQHGQAYHHRRQVLRSAAGFEVGESRSRPVSSWCGHSLPAALQTTGGMELALPGLSFARSDCGSGVEGVSATRRLCSWMPDHSTTARLHMHRSLVIGRRVRRGGSVQCGTAPPHVSALHVALLSSILTSPRLLHAITSQAQRRLFVTNVPRYPCSQPISGRHARNVIWIT